MNLFNACSKYRKLSYLSRDRELTVREHAFLIKHEDVCSKCAPEMGVSMMALDLLQQCAMEAEPRPHFDERVVRRFKVESVRSSARYWSPAVIGAAVAGLVVLAALQMIAQPSRLPSLQMRGGEARNFSTPAFPVNIEHARYDRNVEE